MGIQERPEVPPPQPRPNFLRRQTAPAIDLFYLASEFSNSEETSQSRLWRVSLASKQKWKASVCRNTKSTAGMKRRKGTPSRVLGFRECKQAGNYHRCNKFLQRSEATRPPHLRQTQRMPPFHFQFLRSLTEGPRKDQLPTPLRTPRRRRRHGNKLDAKKRGRAGDCRRTRSSGNPASHGWPVPSGSRLRPPHRPDLHPPRPRLPHLGREPAAADGVAGLSASWGRREAGRGTEGPPTPRDWLCNRQGPQPGRRRRPRGTSASRAPPAAQPGRSLVAAPRGVALPDADATILGTGSQARRFLKLPAPAAEAQDNC